MDQKTQGRVKLIALFAIVFVPAITAAILYYGNFAVSGAQTNKGTLITPPLDIRQFNLANIEYKNAQDIGKDERIWRLVYLGKGACDTDCQKVLYQGRQVHIGLGREANRIKRLYIELDEQLDQQLNTLVSQEHPKLEISYGDFQQWNNQLQAITRTANWLQQNLTFLVDPLGNIMMYYPPDKTGKDMLTDLKLLLKLSKIG